MSMIMSKSNLDGWASQQSKWSKGLQPTKSKNGSMHDLGTVKNIKLNAKMQMDLGM